MKRPLDRGLLAAVKRELAFIIPVSATKLACEVTVGPRSDTSKYTDARAHVRWRTAEGQVLEVNLVGSNGGDEDPSNIALAYLLGRAEKVKTGAGTPVTSDAKTTAKTGDETAVKTAKKTTEKTAKKTTEKTTKKTAERVESCHARGMWRWASLVVVMAVLCVSCEEDDDASDGSVDAGSADVGEPIDTGPAGPDTFDPSCHWDCFFGVTCIDGVVWEQIHAPVPCSAWTGMCPRRELGRCTQGCSDRVPMVTYGNEVDWPLWCEETEASRPGDPCGSDADCQPPEGFEPGGRNYLACDAASSMCVSIDPPVAPTEGCMASFDRLFSPTVGSAYGVVEDDSCTSGLCRFSARGAAGECDRHACAIACDDDWDCPPEYGCEAMPDWTGRAVGDGARGSARVCVGGELVCH